MIACPKCSSQNTINSKYCIICGQSLSKLCKGCKTELPLISNFCSQCRLPQKDNIEITADATSKFSLLFVGTFNFK